MLLLRSKKILNQWADVFDRNLIIAGMNISMNKLSKEKTLTAIAESVEVDLFSAILNSDECEWRFIIIPPN